MRKTTLVTLIAGALALTVFTTTRSDFASARERFNLRTVAGNWGFSAQGEILPPAVLPDASAPAAAVGTIHFDGRGGVVFSDTLNINGMKIGPRTSTSGTYTVNRDGTGEMSVQFPGEPFPVPLSFVIVNLAHEIRFIRTDVGVASGVAKRQ